MICITFQNDNWNNTGNSCIKWFKELYFLWLPFWNGRRINTFNCWWILYFQPWMNHIENSMLVFLNAKEFPEFSNVSLISQCRKRGIRKSQLHAWPFRSIVSKNKGLKKIKTYKISIVAHLWEFQKIYCGKTRTCKIAFVQFLVKLLHLCKDRTKTTSNPRWKKTDLPNR